MDEYNQQLEDAGYDNWRLDNGEDETLDSEISDSAGFCPMCDSTNTFFISPEHYDSQCNCCGHGWEAQ